ncbi:STAS domain-containing protein [Streptomyces sp. NPDC048436]|uniref:STAS domain-containing protein n=1 Tax=Streptomyces sp. NPDC048436 TaxID=3365550 RepID=UPI003716D0FF
MRKGSPLARPEADPPRLSVRALEATDSGDVLTFALAGELDVLSVNLLCDLAITHMEDGHRHLHLDLGEVVWCDNGSLYMILGLRHALQAASGRLGLVAVSAPVEEAIIRNQHSLHLHLHPQHASPCCPAAAR